MPSAVGAIGRCCSCDAFLNFLGEFHYHLDVVRYSGIQTRDGMPGHTISFCSFVPQGVDDLLLTRVRSTCLSCFDIDENRTAAWTLFLESIPTHTPSYTESEAGQHTANRST